jgi:hypothetical protein
MRSLEAEAGAMNPIPLFPSRELQGRECADLQMQKLPNGSLTLY